MTRARLLTIVLLGAAAPLAGQGSDAVYARFNALSGFEFRAFSFDSGLSVDKASQWHVPIVFVAPLGRKLSVDLSTALVGSSLTTVGGTEHINGVTDTQLRLLYALQRDRLAASLLFNLPTGQHSVTSPQFAVSGAVASTFLSFPVSALGTAFGVTGGLAYAARAGAWNLGLAGSVRYQGSYEPLSDATLTISSGIEGRLRAAFDRLIGSRTRLLVGLTGSTLSTDEYSGSGAVIPAGSYRPGRRIITDVGLVQVAGSTTLVLAAWDYYRLSGEATDSAGTTSTIKSENVLNVELRAGIRAGARFRIEPTAAFREYRTAGSLAGRLYTGGLNGSVGLSDHVTAQLGGRFDSGWVVGQAGGFARLTGAGASLMLRLQR